MMGMIKVWASYLEPAELGLMGLVVGVASILLGMGIGPLLQAMFVRYTGHTQTGNARQFRTASGKLVRARTVWLMVLIVLAGYPATWYFALHWATPLAIMGLVIVDVIRAFEQRLFAAARRQRDLALTSAGDVLARLCFVWLFLHWFGGTAYAALFGNLFGAALFVILMRLALRLEAFPGAQDVASDLRQSMETEISRLAKPLLPSMVLANLTEMGNRYFIGATLGLPAAGLFVAGYGFVKRPYGMLNHVGEMTMTPVLGGAIHQGHAAEIRRARHIWLLFVAGLSALGAGLFWVLREPLVTIFLSDKYAGVTELLFGLAVAVSVFNIASVFNWFSMTLGDSSAVLINNIVGAAATSVLTIVLCLMFGLEGAVWALIIGYGLQLATSVLTFRSVRKRQSLADPHELQPANTKS